MKRRKKNEQMKLLNEQFLLDKALIEDSYSEKLRSITEAKADFARRLRATTEAVEAISCENKELAERLRSAAEVTELLRARRKIWTNVSIEVDSKEVSPRAQELAERLQAVTDIVEVAKAENVKLSSSCYNLEGRRTA